MSYEITNGTLCDGCGKGIPFQYEYPDEEFEGMIIYPEYCPKCRAERGTNQ